MPKKQKKPLYTRPTAPPHPSLTSSQSTTAVPHGSLRPEANNQVTESLKSLRAENTLANGRLPPRSPPVATVHPSLRNLLDVPESPQPGGRPFLRTELRAQVRQSAGPAPPPSWQLLASRHARSMETSACSESSKVSTRGMVHEYLSLPGVKYPPERSLLHMVLRYMAAQWDWHLQNDHAYLSSLPLGLKEVLLTYVVRYATDDTLGRSSNTLRALFPTARCDFGTESGNDQGFMNDALRATRLDLSRAIGTWLPKSSLLKKGVFSHYASRKPTSSNMDSGRRLPDRKATREPPDSWDGADTALAHNASRLSVPAVVREPVGLRFSNLLHLSLAVSPSAPSPATAASWSSLLAITSRLSKLQSLSLANWPRPTLTPHAAAVSATIQNPHVRIAPRIPYGGTDMYTEPESTWREAACLMGILSRNLYYLRWLDLSGCCSWFGALLWTDREARVENLSSDESFLHVQGAEWNGSWRNVDFLGLGVGHATPNTMADEQISTSSKDSPSTPVSSSSSSRKWLNSRVGTSSEYVKVPGLIRQDWDLGQERRRYFAHKEDQKLLAIRETVREVTRHVRGLRESAGGKWIEVGF